MRRGKERRERPPLNAVSLGELALTYVGRFATTRAKLRTYLQRKLRERGWDGQAEPDLHGIAERFAQSGYVDDAAFALSKSRALTGRGYGLRRVDQSLRSAGVAEADGAAARDHAVEDSAQAAIRFAKRRRIGPFASEVPDPKARQRALAAMLRAGHGFPIARALVAMAPGEEFDAEDLAGDGR